MSMDNQIIAVIQARIDSKRLSGKVLLEISGKPLLWHIVNRLKQCKTISKIVLATTDEKTDEPLRRYAESQKIEYYAGSQDDILDRLYQTGVKFNSSVLVKVNGDCPLIDPKLIDEGINLYKSTTPTPDLVTNSVIRTFPEGMQYGIFNFKTLSYLHNNLHDKFWREYIQMYIIENKERFSTINVENKKNLSSLRWTVDYYEDLQFIRQIFENLYPNNPLFDMYDVISLLEKRPEIKEINAKHSSELGLRDFEVLKHQHEEKT